MTRKKRFGISPDLSQGFSETINVVENNEDIFRNTILPLSRVELDSDNPRKLFIDLNDVRNGLDKSDLNYSIKLLEFEKLQELGQTIKNSGLLNPIVVYKRGEFYRVVAGERRCLASLIVGKSEIDARVYNEKPKPFELKLIQWVENTAREDLSLKERLGNISDILTEYLRRDNTAKISPTLLSSITGISKSQASYYITVLNAPSDVRELINSGKLNSLDKAAILTTTESDELRKELIEQFISGASLKEIRNTQKQLDGEKPIKRRPVTKINMGATTNSNVIRCIIQAVINQKPFEKFANDFNKVNFSYPEQATKAFKKFLNILEQNIERQK